MYNNETILQGWQTELRAVGKTHGTITVRTSHIRRCLEHVGKPVHDVTRADLIDWLAASNWGPAARKSARSSLRTFWQWCAATGVCDDVASTIPAVRQPRTVPRPCPDVMIRDAIARAPDHVALAIEIMATTGARREECAKIRASDVVPAGRGWSLRITGKGGHTRLVPLPPHLAKRIKARPGWTFPGGVDGHISAGWLGKLITRYLPDGYTPHKLRHRYGTTAYEHSHDLRAVQELLGHRKIDTTQVYVAVSTTSLVDSARATWRVAS
ncbi:tyrosine-type recombinase/integrase [Corynebacterium hindlerae]|uniref:Tyrosine-type recombinase/integrase n=1 Tax=Corynebacterium hindlerae TaxID=699041 RepID=A0A7G5FDN4_9CORY|nr:tyrosine-type recombinase/integrase [Corynebacterium hindlerae]QMV84725.1 tyrosine-type recombinase/integrase [Corynebacterium hindlerae]